MTSVLRPIDVDAMLDRIGFGRFHWLTIPAIGLFVVAQSLQTNLLAFLPPCAGDAFGILPEDAALLASASFAGSCLSTPAFGLLADTHGRRTATLLAIYIMCLAGMGSAAAPTFGWLVFLQALVGIGLGGCCSPFELLAELSPSDSRGRALNAVSWFWSAGSLLTVLLAWMVLSPASPAELGELGVSSNSAGAGMHLVSLWLEPWRLLLFTTNLPVLFASCVLPLVTESPSWLLARGRRGCAKRVLWHIATVNRGGDASVCFSPRTGLLLLSSAYIPVVHGRAVAPQPSAAFYRTAAGSSELGQPLLPPAMPPSAQPHVPVAQIADLQLPEAALGPPAADAPCGAPAAALRVCSNESALSPRRGSWWLGLSPLATPVTGPVRSAHAFIEEGHTSGIVSPEASLAASCELSQPLSAEGSDDAQAYVGASTRRRTAVVGANLYPQARVAAHPRAFDAPSPTDSVHSFVPSLHQRLAEIICLRDRTGLNWLTVRHWLLWFVAGFGWAGIIFSGALSTRTSPTECDFNFGEQAVICAMELPGTLLVQLVVDQPRGALGLLGGRRGVQVFGFGAAGLAVLTSTLCAEQTVATLICNMLARSLVAAANSAMSIAAPELYETTDRGLGSSLARLAYLVGSVPAASWAYASVDRRAIAAGISAANLLAAVVAATLPETTGLQLASLQVTQQPSSGATA